MESTSEVLKIQSSRTEREFKVSIYESNHSEYSESLFERDMGTDWVPRLVLAEGGSLEAHESEQDCQPSGFGRFAHFLTEASTCTRVVYLRIQHLCWSMREPARSSVCLNKNNSDVSCVHMQRRIPCVSCLTSYVQLLSESLTPFWAAEHTAPRLANRQLQVPEKQWHMLNSLLPVASSALAPFPSRPPSRVNLHRPDLWKKRDELQQPQCLYANNPGLCCANCIQNRLDGNACHRGLVVTAE